MSKETKSCQGLFYDFPANIEKFRKDHDLVILSRPLKHVETVTGDHKCHSNL